MSTIVTRAGKGSALTYNEVDSNFTNLNNDKYQAGGALGTPASGNLANCTFPTLNQDTTGNAGTVTNGVYTTGNQTINGTKTFSSTIVGSINGNASTVTDGVYTSDIGSTVQAHSANLDEFATVNPTAAGLALLDDADAAAQRTTLGLGTAATTASTDYATAAQGTKADSALQSSAIGSTVQAYDSNLTSFVNTFTLPTTDGTSGQSLVTNGSGTLSFSSAGAGTVTSVNMTVPTGLAVSGNPVTTSGTLAVAYASGYAIPTTAKQTEWDSAYTQRLQWDGGATNLVAATGRSSLLPSYTSNAGKVLAVNTGATDVEWIAVGGSGTVTSVSGTGTVNGITLTGTVTTSGSLTLGGTLSGIGNSQLTNSSVTFNGQTVALGSSGTITAANPFSLTAGSGISFSSGTTYNGSAAITISASGSMVYPAAGIPNSTGTAWDTSYSVTGTGNVVLSTRPTMSVTGSGFTLQDATDNTKQANFVLSSIPTTTTYAYTLPNVTGTLAALNLAQTWTTLQTFNAGLATLGGTTTTLGGTVNMATIGGNILCTSQTTGLLTLGGVSQTGTITLGQSTVSQTANIQAGATASGSTKTLNIGTGGLAGSTTAITVGSTAGTSTTTLNGSTTASGKFTFGSAIDETVYAVIDAAGVAISPTNGTIQTWTLGANRTPTLGTWDAGESLTLMINDGTAFTVTWTTMGIVWVGGTAPTLATSGFTVIELWRVGSTYYGALVGNVA